MLSGWKSQLAIPVALASGCSVERTVPLSDFSCSVVSCAGDVGPRDGTTTGAHDSGRLDFGVGPPDFGVGPPDLGPPFPDGGSTGSPLSALFPYTPSSVASFTVAASPPAAVLDCGLAVIDRVVIWCGTAPPVREFRLPAVPGAPVGQDAAVVVLSGLRIDAGTALRVSGAQRPVVVVVLGDVEIGGVIDVSSERGGVIGAGAAAPFVCLSSLGLGGAAGAGGGGGGHGSAGGAGGAGSSRPGATGGVAGADDSLDPIRAGCAGGGGAQTPIGGGPGGGAFQLSASGRITIADGARLLANGGGGAGGTSEPGAGLVLGGGGGGSGGSILLEANELVIGAATFSANGGGGGGGATQTLDGNPGAGGRSDGQPALGGTQHGGSGATRDSPAENGIAEAGGEVGGGGGGGVGRIRLNAMSCVRSSSASFSPDPSFGRSTCAGL
ncbi:MAG: hypothetical protein HYV07_06495 [Deltaproteobacteria bacterium]|nr:hypothetical protein [Deltaproteobacteria bacterium]